MEMYIRYGQNVLCFDDYESMCNQIAEEIVCNLQKNPKQLLCIAAGHTSLAVLRGLVHRFFDGKVDFSMASFVAMDEWGGMDADTEGSCGWFLTENFLKKVNYKKENVFLWNGKSKNQVAECCKALDFINRRGAIDYLVLGVGMNGHLALNEPGTGLDSTARVVTLDSLTAAVGQKYFNKSVCLKHGLTLGLSDFARAKRIVLTVSGVKKGHILKRILDATAFEPSIPATALLTYQNASIYFDRDAWMICEKEG